MGIEGKSLYESDMKRAEEETRMLTAAFFYWHNKQPLPPSIAKYLSKNTEFDFCETPEEQIEFFWSYGYLNKDGSLDEKYGKKALQKMQAAVNAARAAAEGSFHLSEDILRNNLNDLSYIDFFRAFGYEDNETVYLRTFHDQDKNAPGFNKEITLRYFDSALSSLHRENSTNRGIFFIVNGCGHSDAAIKKARALFVDFDDYSFEEQLKRLNEWKYEPSVIIMTRKSLHAYWILAGPTEGKDNVMKWRELQNRAINHFGTDPSIENPSRVMRLYGFEHCKKDPVLIRLIKFDPHLTYTMQQIHEAIPEQLTEEQRRKVYKISGPAAGSLSSKGSVDESERIPKGQGHYELMRKIGELVSSMYKKCDDETILAAAKMWFIQRYDGEIGPGFDNKYLRTIQKLRAQREANEKDPDFWRYSVQAWEAETGEKFDKGEVSWDEVRAAGERAQAAGKTFTETDEGKKEHRKADREYPLPDPEEGARGSAEGTTPAETSGADPKQEDPEPLPGLLTYSEAVEELANADDTYIEIKTFPNFSKTARIKKHSSVVLAADTGAGKSSLAINIMNTLNEHYPVMYFNLEMDKLTVLRRLVSIESGIDLDRVEGYKNDEQTADAVNVYLKTITGRKPLQIIQGEYMIEDVEGIIKRSTKDRTETTIVFIDHSLLVDTKTRTAGRYDRFTYISEGLRKIALKYNIILFVLLQQNRSGKADDEERPKNSSLKESGSWENDATHICFLWWDPTMRKKKILLTKNRYGDAGEFTLNYWKKTQTYLEAKEAGPGKAPATTTARAPRSNRERQREKLENAYIAASFVTNGKPTLRTMAEAADVSTATIKRWIKEYGGCTIDGEQVEPAGIDTQIEYHGFIKLTPADEAPPLDGSGPRITASF